MNCYGTNPLYTQSAATMSTQNPFDTTSIGEWSQPIPTDPNQPTSPASMAPMSMSSMASMSSMDSMASMASTAEPLPATLTQTIYTPGFLREHIGELMRVEFLIGNGTTDRVGKLLQVGASFIVLAALDGGSEILCDIYSIKFVTIIQNTTSARLYTAFNE